MHELGADNSRLFPAGASAQQSSFSAWQRRLPEELRLRNFRMLRAADKFLGASHPAGGAMWIALFFLCAERIWSRSFSCTVNV